MPFTPAQRIKELEPQIAESEVKAQFFEAVVKVMNTEFEATLTKKQLMCMKAFTRSSVQNGAKRKTYHAATDTSFSRGIQYYAKEYQALHQRYGITCSMTDGYDCYQNALAERVNGILKFQLFLADFAEIV